MADAKISALTELAEAPAAGDLFAVVDVSDTTDAASGTTKRITAANLRDGLVTSDDVTTIVKLTQTAYDALDPVSATTLYVIVD
jgi:hypothetical protein